MEQHSNLTVVDHPVAADALARLRNAATHPPEFRRELHRIGRVMAPYVTAELPTEARDVVSPLETCPGRFLRAPITIAVVLRAALGFADGFVDLLPGAGIAHLGLVRDPDTLEPDAYLERLPRDVASGPVILLDPMLATGGSVLGALAMLRARGVTEIRIACVVAAPEGVARVREGAPDVRVFAAALDRELNDHGYILPGLGDAGDRQFGTE